MAAEPRRAGLPGGPWRWLVLLAAVSIVELGYVFIASAGRWTQWPIFDTGVDYLADGFRAGHLHLSREPPVALLRQSNPFDPANRKLWFWDASLYGGHYYLYWGPVPALLLAAVKSVLRISKHLGDQYVVFGLATLQLIAGTILADRIARRVFASIPVAFVMLAVVVFGFANPTPFLLAREAIYEAAIIGGHAFLLLGLVFAFDAVWKVASRLTSNLYAAAAGIAWALALGCRITLGPAVLALARVTAFIIARRVRERWSRFAQSLLWLGLPVMLGVGGLLFYNELRFERWFEFGRSFQLTWIDFPWSTSFVTANLYSYALRPLDTSCKFPFVSAAVRMGARAFPEGFSLPKDYFVDEQVAGFLVATPWTWLAPAAVLVCGWTMTKVLRRSAAFDGPAAARAWATASLAIAGSVSFAPALCTPTATMRHMGDVAGAIVLLATLGAWSLYAAARRTAVFRWLVVVACSALAAVTVSMGLGLGFEGYYGHFRAHNPALLDELEARWSVCHHQ